MTEELKRSPLPWRVNRKLEVGYTSQEDDQSYGMLIPIADVYGENKESDGAYILKAVNSHAALVEALEALKELTATLRKDAPGTALNNHKYTSLGIKANNAIIQAEKALNDAK